MLMERLGLPKKQTPTACSSATDDTYLGPRTQAETLSKFPGCTHGVWERVSFMKLTRSSALARAWVRRITLEELHRLAVYPSENDPGDEGHNGQPEWDQREENQLGIHGVTITEVAFAICNS